MSSAYDQKQPADPSVVNGILLKAKYEKEFAETVVKIRDAKTKEDKCKHLGEFIDRIDRNSMEDNAIFDPHTFAGIPRNFELPSPEDIVRIWEAISSSADPLRTILHRDLNDLRLTPKHIYTWCYRHPWFYQEYQKARSAQRDVSIDSTNELCDMLLEYGPQIEDKDLRKFHLEATKLKIENRRWMVNNKAKDNVDEDVGINTQIKATIFDIEQKIAEIEHKYRKEY